jgi:hypothetical protein
MSLLADLRTFASARGLVFCPDPSDDGVSRASVYSQDNTKRYAYVQLWQPDDSMILWIMLNPGTGDTEMRRRNTLERCKLWSQRWGFGGLLIGNVFPTRAKSARSLARLNQPSDPVNDQALHFLVGRANEIVVAWGSKVRVREHAPWLLPLLHGAKCLGTTAKGEPRHPLYIATSVTLEPWNYHVLSVVSG